MAHTPGPWKLDKDCGDFDTLAVYAPDGRKIVFWGGRYNAPSQEGEDNARLIAAAPDLLRLLKAAMAYINDEAGKPGITWLRREARVMLANVEGMA